MSGDRLAQIEADRLLAEMRDLRLKIAENAVILRALVKSAERQAKRGEVIDYSFLPVRSENGMRRQRRAK